jgi:large subunit ribosomal protein L31
MKENIHPKYVKSMVKCACGTTFETVSARTRSSGDLLELPPLLTGKQKLIDTAGRIEKFNKKYTKEKKA